jgi:hypothetical protein
VLHNNLLYNSTFERNTNKKKKMKNIHVHMSMHKSDQEFIFSLIKKAASAHNIFNSDEMNTILVFGIFTCH